MPWNKKTRERPDLKRAEQILDEDHYGLEKIKERILEFLAVRRLVEEAEGLDPLLRRPAGRRARPRSAKSIARATGRKFVRLSLGGVRDEAEIRGHRRTYIGALPGQIIQMMKKAGTRNPVFLLDEVDKMAMDFRGDPSAALLEVLDPEQNYTFVDHYLDVEFDLSNGHVHRARRTSCTRSRRRCRTAWRSSGCRATPSRRRLAIAQQFLVPKQMQATASRSRTSTSTTRR